MFIQQLTNYQVKAKTHDAWLGLVFSLHFFDDQTECSTIFTDVVFEAPASVVSITATLASFTASTLSNSVATAAAGAAAPMPAQTSPAQPHA